MNCHPCLFPADGARIAASIRLSTVTFETGLFEKDRIERLVRMAVSRFMDCSSCHSVTDYHASCK